MSLFEKKIVYGQYEVVLSVDDHGCNFNNNSLENINIILSDHPVSINWDINEFSITGSFFGGYRIYWFKKSNTIYITDHIIDFISLEELSNLGHNEFEYEYFTRHGFSSGDETIYEGIHKLPPSSTLIVSKNGVRVHTDWHYGNIINEPNVDSFKKCISNAVDKALLKCGKRLAILCYSGGIDSTFLLKRIRVLGIPHKLVFFLDRNYALNVQECEEAKHKAKMFGEDLDILDITGLADDEVIENKVKELMAFDIHEYRGYFYGIKKITQKYGKDIVVVNGQNSDCILSFGPSERKYSSYLKRYLLYGSSYLMKYLITKTISLAFRKSFSVPRKREDRLLAFYDNFKYCLFKQNGNSAEYENYFIRKFNTMNCRFEFTTENNFWMYLKYFSYMQGGDCQSVVQSAILYGIKIIMPLSQPEVISATLKYKDNIEELNNPKYVLL